VTAPPLRDRPDDIPLLAEHFAELFATEMGRSIPVIDADAQRALRAYAFPGNVRELKNVMERALLASAGADRIMAQHLRFDGAAQALSAPGYDTDNDTEPPGVTKAPSLPLDLDEAVIAAERWVVEQALARSEGNVSAATRLLGTNRNRVYRILGQRSDAGD